MNDYMKTVVSGMKAYVDNIDNDWNQNDPSATDYIKNRTHYSETKEVELFNKSSLPFEYNEDDMIAEWWDKCKFSLTKGKLYTVIWDGVVYEDLKAFNYANSVSIGAPSWDETTKTMPFMISTAEWDGDMEAYIVTYSSATSHSIIIKTMDEIVHKIDKKYLPEMTNIKNIMDGSAEGSVRSIGAIDEVMGLYAFAEGYETAASGRYSHAEGYGTSADGEYSHSEGYETYTSGNYSHVEGYMTSVHADSSHAEGESTNAYGSASHSEGYRTGASGNYSHAEGTTTRAYGIASHAEGDRTVAFGDYSHAEGSCYNGASSSVDISGPISGTTYRLSQWNSYIEIGRYLKIGDTYGKIIDYSKDDLTVTLDKKLTDTTISGHITFFASNVAFGQGSHIEGAGTIATGNSSHAEGYNTIADGAYTHAEGFYTAVYGDAAHAEGIRTAASGDYSHAEGGNTTASGPYSHAEGQGTTASGNYSHAEGGNTTASGLQAHAEGYSTTASGDHSHAEGRGTIASSLCQHVQGKYNIEANTRQYAHIVGNGESSTSRSNAHTLDWDGNAWFAGSVTTGDDGLALSPVGKNVHVIHLIESNPTADIPLYSEIFNDYVNNVATGTASHAEGYATIAKGDHQHVQGKCNIEDTENKYAHIVGNGVNKTSRSNAHTLDWNGNAWFAGKVTIGPGNKELATKADISTLQAKFDNLIQDAPEAYDTLKEVGTYISTHKTEYDALLALTQDKVSTSQLDDLDLISIEDIDEICV